MQDKYYQFDKINNDSVLSFYTKIPFNFSRKYVSRDEIDRQYKEIEDDFKVEFKYIKYMKQVHKDNIKIVTSKDLDIECYEDYDGLLTDIPYVALTTITADCQAIFLYDKHKKVIGNIHSGWKGTLLGIGSKAIKMMIDNYGCKIEDIEVYINPSILVCSFEVEEDVLNLFKDKYDKIDEFIKIGDIKKNKQKYYIDTVGINKREFIKLGVLEENINLSNICTRCNCDIYHSFRNEGIGTGQNIGFIMLTK